MDKKQSPVWFLRLLYSSRIFIILIALVFAVVIWQKNTAKLTESIDNLSVSNPNIPLLESGITRLYQADNNFRLYTITYDKRYFSDFTDDIRYISGILDTIRKQNETDTTSIQLAGVINEKTSVAQVLVQLKKLTDSLLLTSSAWDTTLPRKIQLPTYDIEKLTHLTQTTTTDTINLQKKKDKRGFFRKVKELFKEDVEQGAETTIVKRTETTDDTTIVDQVTQSPEYIVLNDIHDYYLQKFSKLADGRNRLNDKEIQMASINNDLIAQMKLMFTGLRDKEAEKVRKIKADAVKTGDISAKRISIITIVAFILASLFYFLILYYLRKISEHNKHLVNQQSSLSKTENEKARLKALIGQIADAETIDIKSKEQLKALSSALNCDVNSGEYSTSTLFNPYNLISSVSGKILPHAKAKSLMIESILPINQPVEITGNHESLSKVIEGLLNFAISKSLNGDIKIAANVESINNSNSLHVEITDHAIPFNDKLVQEYLSENIPGIASNPADSLAELEMINARKMIEKLGGLLRIQPIQNCNKYSFSLSFPKQT